MTEKMKEFLKKAIASKLAAILLIVVGITGFLTSGIVIYIVALFLILAGIYGIIKKLYFVGIIAILFGVLVFVFFKFFNSLTKFVSSTAIILGIALLIYSFIQSKLQSNKQQPK